jgi:sortase A
MFRGASLLKVGVIMTALALGVVICAVVVSVALRGSFGAEGNAAEKSSSEKEPPGYSSSEKGSLRQEGSSSDSGGPAGRSEREAKGAQRVAAASEAEPSSSRSAISQHTGQRTASGAPSRPESPSRQNQARQEDRFLPAAEDDDWPQPTQREVRRANSARHYELLPGALMGLTIEDIGIYDAPVFDSDGPDALANGVAHVPGTSWPWSPTPQRNVYLAGHRMGFRGTWSRMLFYNLDELEEGDRVVLRDRSGRSYEYKVSEVFLADPTDAWVMGQVRGRDMLSLQTCTPLYTFEKRLIVRADRV